MIIAALQLSRPASLTVYECVKSGQGDAGGGGESGTADPSIPAAGVHPRSGKQHEAVLWEQIAHDPHGELVLPLHSS